ncbi:MAG: acyltransferase family protein [Clostridia bacterium]|nr:acyltransferase family protein [Clostridia bacterium]
MFCFYHSARGQTPAAPLPVYLLTAPVHLWYIWALMLLYLMSPALYIFCKNAGKKVYLYALGFTLLSGAVVTLLVRSGVSETFSAVVDRAKLPYQLGSIFCFIFGDCCRRHAPRLSARAGLHLRRLYDAPAADKHRRKGADPTRHFRALASPSVRGAGISGVARLHADHQSRAAAEKDRVVQDKHGYFPVACLRTISISASRIRPHTPSA